MWCRTTENACAFTKRYWFRYRAVSRNPNPTTVAHDLFYPAPKKTDEANSKFEVATHSYVYFCLKMNFIASNCNKHKKRNSAFCLLHQLQFISYT